MVIVKPCNRGSTVVAWGCPTTQDLSYTGEVSAQTRVEERRRWEGLSKRA